MAGSHSRSGRTVRKASVKRKREHEVGLAERKIVSAAAGSAALSIPARADAVAHALGSKANLALLLKVSPSQPTRWIRGDETPNAENTRAIVDLDHVVARARLLWGDEETVTAWLNGRNAFLDGARPIDVVTLQGSGPVIEALDQETAGVYA